MLPYSYDHWKKRYKLDVATTQTLPDGRKSVQIWCPFCDGYRAYDKNGEFPQMVYRGRQPGTLTNPRRQTVKSWAKAKDETCPVCLGHHLITVIADSDKDPWEPCQACETYGRQLIEEGIDGSHTICTVIPEPCPYCKGLGFTLASEKKAYTGETRRL